MTTIILYGEMAEKFCPSLRANVRSVGEAVRAIDANYPGFIEYLGESGNRGVDFNVKVNERDTIDETELRADRDIESIKISPVVRGSKDSITQVVIGVVLIVVAIVTQQYYMIPGAFGGISGGVTIAGTITNMIGFIGVSMAISGVAQMIAGTPNAHGPISDDAGQQNALFDGPENTVTQGGAVPVIYGGPLLVGSRVVSAGVYTEDTGNGGPFHNVENPYDGYDPETGGAAP